MLKIYLCLGLNAHLIRDLDMPLIFRDARELGHVLSRNESLSRLDDSFSARTNRAKSVTLFRDIATNTLAHTMDPSGHGDFNSDEETEDVSHFTGSIASPNVVDRFGVRRPVEEAKVEEGFAGEVGASACVSTNKQVWTT